MTQPIIEITGLGKKYRFGALREPYLSLHDSLARTTRGFVKRLSRLSSRGQKSASKIQGREHLLAETLIIC